MYVLNLRTQDRPMVSSVDRLVGLVVKASASRVADLGSIPAFPVGLFPGRVILMISKLVLQKLVHCQALGDTGSALGLAGPCQYTVTG